MTKSQAQPDRVFLRPQYAIFYRRTRRLRWLAEARAEYTTFFLLGGVAAYELSENAGESAPGGALLLDPGLAAKASGQGVEYVSLTLSPSYVLDCAVRTRLVQMGNRVNIRGNHLNGCETPV